MSDKKEAPRAKHVHRSESRTFATVRYRHHEIREKYGTLEELKQWLSRHHPKQPGIAGCVVNRIYLESRYGSAVDTIVDATLAAYLADRTKACVAR